MAQTTFIGRRTELQRLEESLKHAEAGQLQVIFIAGEAGAGKTALVEEFIRGKEEADPKLITAIGECNAQTGAGDPYLPFRQVLTSLTTEPEEKKSTAETTQAKNTTRLKEFVRISSETVIRLGPDLIDIFVPGGKLLTTVATIATEVAVSSGLVDKLSERIGKKRGPEPVKVNPALDQEKIFEQYASVLKVLSKDRTLTMLD
jgi:predicted ATPase